MELACPGVVLDQVLALKGMSGFARGYAVTRPRRETAVVTVAKGGGWWRLTVTRRIRRDAAREAREQPGTTGLKVHCERNGDGAFQHPPSPILAR